MKKNLNLSIILLASFTLTVSAWSQPHAGQMDTDGILSPGEVRNPRINYNRAQRDYERRGDYRVENPYNDDAASDQRRYQYRDDAYRNDRLNDGRDRLWSERRKSWLDRGADYPYPW